VNSSMPYGCVIRYVPFGAVLATSLFDHLRGKEAHAESVAEVFA